MKEIVPATVAVTTLTAVGATWLVYEVGRAVILNYHHYVQGGRRPLHSESLRLSKNGR